MNIPVMGDKMSEVEQFRRRYLKASLYLEDVVRAVQNLGVLFERIVAERDARIKSLEERVADLTEKEKITPKKEK